MAIEEPPTEGLVAKGFGVEIGARGALVVIVIIMLAVAGLMIWTGEQIQRGVADSRREHHGLIEAVTKELAEHGQRTLLEHSRLEHTLKILACAAWYTPEERKAIRLKIEQQPALANAWCPSIMEPLEW